MSHTLTISIVGRVNVGKSTIFNHIIGKKKALVSNTPRVTRDRNIALVDNQFSKPFTLIDTGGFEKECKDVISYMIEAQIKSAIEASQVILFVVDGKEGLMPMDFQLLREIRKIREDFDETVYLLVNKIDDLEKHAGRELAFTELGVEKLYPVSAEASIGINDLIEEILDKFELPLEPIEAVAAEETEDIPKIVVIGKPNVGKSSFINSVLGTNRLIVHEKAGTTRDPIDVRAKLYDREFIFVDTAGMRKKAKVIETVEKLSMMFAERSIERADIVLLMIDASDNVSDQDIRLIKIVDEMYKSIILVVNKSDLLREKEMTKIQVKDAVRDKIHFAKHIPIKFISVKTGEGYKALAQKISDVEKEFKKRIATSKLNKFYNDEIAFHSMPIRQGKKPKVFYITQERSSPPTFILFCNYPDLVEESYKKYILNKFRQEFNFEGVSIKLVFKKKK